MCCGSLFSAAAAAGNQGMMPRRSSDLAGVINLLNRSRHLVALACLNLFTSRIYFHGSIARSVDPVPNTQVLSSILTAAAAAGEAASRPRGGLSGRWAARRALQSVHCSEGC